MKKIVKTSLKEIESFRIQYFDSLPAFQDIYLELIVNKSYCYKLISDDRPIGYVIISVDRSLLELYIEPKNYYLIIDFFSLVINQLNVRNVYCKSFDSQLLDCCLINNLNYHIIGCLFRDIQEVSIQLNTDLSYRYADNSDLPFLYQQDDEVFEPKELLDTIIQNKGILILQLADLILGCGLITKVHPVYKYYDLGVWISPEYRLKGYATQLILYMKNLCLNNGWLPICGCDIKNIASQKMLNGSGFISRYKLIEFETR